ncbi:hypothetical protein [Streptomyces sp. SID2888]|uniref:hypothetical protein n=1 Tax=Streptomyces sp. SID2888 TaxID=2690256 RepID=UPI001371AAEB|nr:hypothetical protein [Streptomyces sp. SID2888]MYV46168.1 hypothetical protein [Streptomyces sp. SID2888]
MTAAQVPAVIPAPAFEEQYVPTLVGDPMTAGRFTAGGADVLLGPAGTLIITEADDEPARSGVWNAEEVRLVGPAPAPVTERLLELPWGADQSSLPIHIAVRAGADVLYLGTAWVSQAGTTNGTLTDCELRFDTPLARELLDRARPPRPPGDMPGLAWLAQVNGDRAAALEQFITGWYPATGATLGAPSGPTSDATEPLPDDSASRLPDGLRQLYRLAKQRPGALGSQNRILPEPNLRTDPLGEMLVFGVENQGGFFWSLLWDLDGPEADPTVWFREFDEQPIAEQEPLGGFLIQFSLFEASMGADYLALPRKLTAPQVDRLTQPLTRVPLRPFWPWVPTHFYVAPGLVLHVSSSDGETFDAWAGATHRSALTPLSDLPLDWNRFDG